jgi:hypothetical protein
MTMATEDEMSFEDKREALVQANVGEEHLDQIVHEAKSKEASEINNEGIDAQLTYLFSNKRMSVSDILGTL